MSDLRRYRCKGCGVIFTCDLEILELRACPVCANYGTLELASNTIILCSNCGLTIYEHEAEMCATCYAPLCSECAQEEGCPACRAERDFLAMPVEGRPC